MNGSEARELQNGKRSAIFNRMYALAEKFTKPWQNEREYGIDVEDAFEGLVAALLDFGAITESEARLARFGFRRMAAEDAAAYRAAHPPVPPADGTKPLVTRCAIVPPSGTI